MGRERTVKTALGEGESMEYYLDGKDLLVEGLAPLSLPDTLDCGQSFRWRRLEEDIFEGMAGCHYLKIGKEGESFRFYDTGEELFLSFWKGYFDMETDYQAICQRLVQDEVMAKAAAYAPGIRVLRQDGWEALISFIISQNNNVARIKGIVERLCQTLGEEVLPGWYSFPTPERLAACTVEELAPLRAGFRAKYLVDAAQKVASGQVELAQVASLPTPQARELLMLIKGVGVKVADCALLYGFGKMDCFPQDVWIKRAVACLYPQGVPEIVLEHPGIAQQYIFHYARTCPAAFAGMEKKV